MVASSEENFEPANRSKTGQTDWPSDQSNPSLPVNEFWAVGSGTIEDLFILRDHFSEIAEQRKKRKYTKKDFIYWKKDWTM